MGAAETEPRGVAITSIQPGGGFYFRIEAGWGRLRRAWLRLARAGYVRECPGCAHDIIDMRDLKLWANVCGYSFAAEDDAFKWRDRIPFARAGLAEVVTVSLFSAVVIPLVTAFGGWLHVLGGLAWLHLAFVLWFFRDPERTVTASADALLSPADGVVTHLEEVDAPDFPSGRAFRISMWLSPLNVHLSRAPRDAKVVRTRYFPGRFVNARRPDSAKINEQLWSDWVEPNGRFFRVIQISGSLARRLVCQVRSGDEVRRGDRYGMIKYGSRCDVLVPVDPKMKVAVKIGDKTYAALTVLMRFEA
jgi:phosphatidylserine decarboxylase